MDHRFIVITRIKLACFHRIRVMNKLVCLLFSPVSSGYFCVTEWSEWLLDIEISLKVRQEVPVNNQMLISFQNYFQENVANVQDFDAEDNVVACRSSFLLFWILRDTVLAVKHMRLRSFDKMLGRGHKLRFAIETKGIPRKWGHSLAKAKFCRGNVCRKTTGSK